jgi:Fe-coproporphyrin III synthase
MPIDQDPALPMPHQPGTMLIHLLNRCNLACQYCYLDAGPRRDTSLPVQLVTRSMGESARLGIGSVWLSGGEPFLYPDLAEVLRSAAAQDSVRVFISTNGTLIGPEEAALLNDTGAKAQVSLDGPEDYHDEVRGLAGAFRRTSRAIENLTAAGALQGIVVVVCEDNLALLPWLTEWAAGMGVPRITAQPLLQFGRGAQIKQKRLSEEQLCDLFLQLSDLSQAYSSRGVRFALSFRTRRLLAEHPCAAYVCNGALCHRGVAQEIKRLVIREDGTVFPESPMMDPRFALGSVYDGTLEELVAGYFAGGYAQFDRLCRSVYQEVMPAWTSPLIPWDEILCEHSWTFDGSTASQGG